MYFTLALLNHFVRSDLGHFMTIDFSFKILYPKISYIFKSVRLRKLNAIKQTNHQRVCRNN